MKMAAKKNKAKKLSIVKSEATYRLPWPWSRYKLPQNLIQVPLNRMRGLHFTTDRSTTKSWLTPTRRCNATEQHRWCDQLIYHSANSDSFKNSSTCYSHNRFLGKDLHFSTLLWEKSNASNWCILKDDSARQINPSSTLSLNRENSYCVVVNVMLGGDVNIPSSSVMVNYIVYYRSYCNKYVSSALSYDHVWVRYECTTVDPLDAKKNYMKFTNVVRLEGKYYALTLQGTLVVMEDVNSRLVITTISTNRGIPSMINFRFFKEYLIELNGEILLIFLIHRRSVQNIEQIEVFRLCLIKLDWIKVESLQGKTLFLDECCIWAYPDEVGCKENCVYFTQGSNNGWWIYDMKSCCISPAVKIKPLKNKFYVRSSHGSFYMR